MRKVIFTNLFSPVPLWTSWAEVDRRLSQQHTIPFSPEHSWWTDHHHHHHLKGIPLEPCFEFSPFSRQGTYFPNQSVKIRVGYSPISFDLLSVQSKHLPIQWNSQHEGPCTDWTFPVCVCLSDNETESLTCPALCRFPKWTSGMKRTGWESRSSMVFSSVLSAFLMGEIGPEPPFFPNPQRDRELSICCQATTPNTDWIRFGYICLSSWSSAELFYSIEVFYNFVSVDFKLSSATISVHKIKN